MDRVVFSSCGKRYGSLWALRGVDATLRAGETVMVIGPNGSGKTTLIKCLLGLVRPTEGSIRVNGSMIGTDPEYRGQLGYMPQISGFPGALTIAQLLDMMADIRGISEAERDVDLMKDLGLDNQLCKRLGTLSGGTRQKVSAVMAFSGTPEILVLDEPTAGLDPLSARQVLSRASLAKDRGAAVIITSHLMEEVESLADRVAYLQDGRLLFLLPLKEMLARTGTGRLAEALPVLLEELVPHA
ncbi:MAG: ABC transporter ATP-binding protein [Flavobacteriales bacterium]|nr:ABC transporter ATP-binding protein [Flavobacteriales bacterium]MCB0787991.1 ABC transporter ATP-binding protein [Flavobacteriales bacterium]MCB0808241.1 ABC transporter ATP-binding protein [Flavobacteriales bacterium]MCB0812042.1 ABC transporter ATP-binding protein [Flavobacteriales bacterium]MCB0815888.1 ABC transporter ATP-binding protein [Flavobacteriales bacterium]